MGFSFPGTGIQYNKNQSYGTSGSSPVGQQARNSPEGRAVYGSAGSQFRDAAGAVISQGDQQYNKDLAYLQQQGYLQGLGYQQQMDALYQQLAAAGGQAGVAGANNQIALDALKRQGPLLDALLGLDKGGLNRQLENLLFGLDQARAGYNDKDAALNQSGEQLDYSKLRNTQNVQTAADDAIWNLRSDATARGAVSTAGTRRGYDTIQTQLQRSLGDIDKQFGWGKSDLDRARSELGRNKAATEQAAKSGYGEILDTNQRLDLTDAEKRAQLDDEKKRLENAAKSIGLSASETAARIQGQLSSLGIDQMMSYNDVLRGLDDLRNNRSTNLGNALNVLAQQYGIDWHQVAGSP